jgi:hypothetical protein
MNLWSTIRRLIEAGDVRISAHGHEELLKTLKKLIHEGDYMAEMELKLELSDDDWAPYISLDDALHVDDVREALQSGDVRTAEKYATVFEVIPLQMKVAEDSNEYKTC